AHNPDGIRALLSSIPEGEVEFYFAASRGKDIRGMCEQLLSRGKVYYLDTSHQRLLGEGEFRATYPELSRRVYGFLPLSELNLENKREGMVICGSIFLVDLARSHLLSIMEQDQ
ncbi:hypothetical protein ACFLRA_02130, partial [Bdellovibrionota bacterium]